MDTDPLPAKESRHARYNKSAKGRTRKADYRKRTGRYTTTTKYLSKPFIGVDGESVNNGDGSQRYVYLALSTGQSIRNDAGLSTMQILTFLSRNLPESKNGINVIYGGGYDFNFWVKDLPRPLLEALYKGNYRSMPVIVGAYQLRWQKGKSFTIKSSGGKIVTINDISSFFQTPFVDALDEWLVEYEGREEIRTGKAGRDGFMIEDIDWIIKYNGIELERLVELATRLRESYERCGIRPRRWTGPGNAVSALFRRYKIKEHMNKAIPEYVASAARYAYAGGRIEMIRFGDVSHKPSYQYDINGAYLEGTAELPSLAGGTWRQEIGDPGDHPFALYKVSIHAKDAWHPTPMFNRGAHGVISFPMHTHNWVWSPEMIAVRKWAERLGGKYVVTEAMIFEPATKIKPFQWIRELYAERAEMKAKGDPGQLALKITLAAVYGKLAQQLGYIAAKGRRDAEIPPYHQLEWAGYVTAYTRAKMYLAALENPANVIAFETDALFMADALEGVTVGTGLGEWKVTQYRSLLYVQSGIYSAEKMDGEIITKVRGFSADWLTPEAIREAIKKPEKDRLVVTEGPRFIGLGTALQVPEMAYWRHWVMQERILRCFPLGKRIHYLCSCEGMSEGLYPGFWHQTTCPVREQISREYPVLWINPDPEMQRLADMREAISEWD